jgi:hypothetical protein
MSTTEFKITVEKDFSMSKAELYAKVKHWLEHNAHTCCSFGFSLKEISYLGRDDE